MQLGIRIIATAELGRQADYPDWQPKLSDLRESDVLAQTADLIMLLTAPNVSDRDHRHGEAKLLVAKNRYGRRGVVTLAKNLHLSRFETLTQRRRQQQAERGGSHAHVPSRDDNEGYLAPSHSDAASRLAPVSGSRKEQLIAVDGIGLTIRSTGVGGPPLICVSCAGGAHDEWDELRARLDSLTQIITYGRPGLGGSDRLPPDVADRVQASSGPLCSFTTSSRRPI
jgi:hypothetical protein